MTLLGQHQARGNPSHRDLFRGIKTPHLPVTWAPGGEYCHCLATCFFSQLLSVCSHDLALSALQKKLVEVYCPMDIRHMGTAPPKAIENQAGPAPWTCAHVIQPRCCGFAIPSTALSHGSICVVQAHTWQSVTGIRDQDRDERTGK